MSWKPSLSMLNRLMKKAKRPRESLGDVVRRMLSEADDDLDAYLADLIANPPKVDTALLRRLQSHPVRSARPSRRRHAA